MSIQGLNCKECGAAYELSASYVCENCFGPLEVAYDHSDLDPVEAKRRIQAGSQGIWRYADFLPFEGRPGDPLEPGLTPLLRADRLAERLEVDGEIWIKNDAANPTCALATATATTRSLKEWVGLAASFLIQISASVPSRSERRSALISGVMPGSSGSEGLPSNGRKSEYRQIPRDPAWIRRRASSASSPE